MRADSVWLIKDMIEKSKRQFKIPVYQRNYDWTFEHCKKLFEDIIDAQKDDIKHFTGTIVYIKGYHSSRFDEDIIIDGQQRITTILLLLRAIYDKAVECDDHKIISEIPDYLFNKNCDDVYKLKLKPVKSDNYQFTLLMRNSIPEMNTSSNIFRNYNFFVKLMSKALNDGISLNEILYGIKKLEVVEIILDEERGDNPQNIFESINSTGLDLSIADLIRNFLLMTDGNQELLYSDYWLPIEKIIMKENLTSFITDYLSFKSKENITSKNIYVKFKDFYYRNEYTNELVMKELKYYSRFYTVFIGESSRYNSHINKLMSDLRILNQTTIYPFLLPIFEDHEKSLINDNELIKILTFFVNYSLRRIITGVPSNSLRGLYKTLYKRIFRNQDDKNNYYETIHKFFMTISTKDRVPTDEEFKNSLITSNLYQKRNICKFILTTIENEGKAEQIKVNSLTIEHVMPQTLNKKWQDALGSKFDEIWSKYVHTLGNLTITGYNGELSNNDFLSKKEIITKHSKARILNEDILSSSKWSEKEIIKRASKLSSYLLKLFKFDDIVSVTNFKGSNGDYLTVKDCDKIKNTKPISFSIMGEIRYVDTYIGLAISCFELLYELDDKILSDLAESNYSGFSNDRAIITYDKTKLRRAKEIKDSGIYIEANLSSKYLILLISGILEEYEIPEEEFRFNIVASS